MDVVDRLFALVDEKYDEQKAFAAVIGVDPNLPSRWRNRKSQSYQKYLPQIAEALGTTTEYLLTGEGPKKKSAPAVSDSATISEEEYVLLRAYRRADDHTKSLVDLALEPFK